MSKEKITTENIEGKETVESVPYLVYEAEQARSERSNKRLLIALIVSLVMLFISNFAWLIAWYSYDYVVENITVESTADGDAYYNEHDNDGNIYYGEGYGYPNKEG